MESPLPRKPGRTRWGWTLVLAGFVLMTVGYFTLPLGVFGPTHPIVSWSAFIGALVLIAGLLLWQIQLVRQESGRGWPALTIALLSCLSLLVFAAAYLALARHSGEFAGLHTRVDALYFTVITMATIGYGDITPTGQEARSVVLAQIVYTFVFLAAGASALSQQLRGRAAVRALAHRRRAGQQRDPGAQGPGA